MNAAANILEKVLPGHHAATSTPGHIAQPSGETAEPGSTMRALTWQGKNKVAVSTVPKPALVQPDDVILKVTGSTICGSDLHLYHNAVVEMRPGDILGHEFCGVVESVGSAVHNIKPGKRYVASFQIACGKCRFCKQKLTSQCERTNDSKLQEALYGTQTAGLLGYSHLTGGFAGGQAEYVRVPHAEFNLLEIPDDVPDERALYLSDILPTSYHAVHDTRVYPGDNVAIWGAGPIGLWTAVWAQKAGAKRVILIDNNWRLEYAKKKIPGVETINYSELPTATSVTAKIHELVPGGVDVAIECVAGEYAKGWAHYFEILLGMETDTSEIVNEMITSTRNFGRCGITGAYVGFTNHFNIGSLMERGIRLIGNGQAPVQKYWNELLEMIRKGEVDAAMFVSHRIDLEDIELCYKKFDERKEEDGLMKVYVQTKHSAKAAEGTPALTSL